MDEPQNHDVGRDAQEHVDELQHQVEDEHSGHICAAAVDRLLDCRDVQRPLADEQRRVDESEEL